jgi:hypothetical protein
MNSWINNRLPQSHLGGLPHGVMPHAANFLGMLAAHEGINHGSAEGSTDDLGTLFSQPRTGVVSHLECSYGTSLESRPRRRGPDLSISARRPLPAANAV